MKKINFLLLSFLVMFSFFVVSNAFANQRVPRGVERVMQEEELQVTSVENDIFLDIEPLEERREQVKNINLEKATNRRSQVANAVQEMLQVAERNGGIGEQVRLIAQNQERNQERIESSLEKIQNQNKFSRFLFGPDRQEIKTAKMLLEENKDKLDDLENFKAQLEENVDREKIEEQIQKLKEVRSEVEKKVEQSKKVFSLFGWALNIFSR